MLIGHNRHIAWGITASMADVGDLYVERIDPGDSRRTEFAGHWETGTLIREVIAVKGRAHPWVEEVLITRRHGPLLTPDAQPGRRASAAGAAVDGARGAVGGSGAARHQSRHARGTSSAPRRVAGARRR